MTSIVCKRMRCRNRTISARRKNRVVARRSLSDRMGKNNMKYRTMNVVRDKASATRGNAGSHRCCI